MYSREVALQKIQLALLDGAVVFSAAMGATWLRHGLGVLSPEGAGGGVPWLVYLLPSLIVSLAFVVLFRYQGLYTVQYGRLIEASRILKASSIATMAVLTLTFFYRGYSYSRATVILFFPLSFLGLVAFRNAYRIYRRRVLGSRKAVRRVLIVGFGVIGQQLGRELLKNPAYYQLVGFLDDDPLKATASLEQVPVVGTTRDLGRSIAELDVDEVIFAIPSAPQGRLLDLVGECLRLRVRWKMVPNLCDLMLERVYVDRVGGLPLVGLRGSQLVGFNWIVKRAFDVLFSITLMVLLAPLFLALALAVKLTSRGPVLYRQTRVGLNGRPFTFLKFRSMRVENDPAIHRQYTADWIYGRTGNGNGNGSSQAREETPGGVHKIVRDPRITAVGRFLRGTSLDELPQFWNVLRGSMSVVGPRPPIPYEVERYTEWHKKRLEAPPGITGLWQISGRNALSFDEMVRLDIEYIETWSLEQDVKIVLKTLPALFLQRAY